MRLIRNDSGETLVETLVALVVCVLSILMLFSATSIATNINMRTYEIESELQQQLENVEKNDFSTTTSSAELVSPSDGTQVTPTRNVRVYGEAIVSYEG